MRIKDMCADEMPRERLLDKGAAALSNVELLAILLRTGRDGKNVIDMAREVLQSGDGLLAGVAQMSVEGLCRVSGIGPGKAVTLAAAFELGRRVASEKADDGCQICSPARVFSLMLPVMRNLDHEECWALLLNKANRLICRVKMSSGGLESTVIDCKSVIRKAIEKKASGVILVHNHPSGNALPSQADINQTQVLTKAMKMCELSLLDHVIIGRDGYYSFADDNMVTKF